MKMQTKREFDPMAVTENIVTWLRVKLVETGAKGFVVGLSGGIDSAVVAALVERAVPTRENRFLIMPCESAPVDQNYAELLAVALGIRERAEVVNLDDAFGGMIDHLAVGLDERMVRGNMKARLRMTALYAVSGRRHLLVAGTDNAPESYIGYFTKYGDGGVDVLPISSLLKREVRELGRFLGVPEVIVTRVPTAGLWAGQTDEGEMGFTYDQIDTYLEYYKASPAELAEMGVPVEVSARIAAMHDASAHKRRMPESPLIHNPFNAGKLVR
jgi:NAD+ synthase